MWLSYMQNLKKAYGKDGIMTGIRIISTLGDLKKETLGWLLVQISYAKNTLKEKMKLL